MNYLRDLHDVLRWVGDRIASVRDPLHRIADANLPRTLREFNANRES